MAIATTGKDVLAKFFDEGAYSALYADGAVTAAFGSANGTPVYAVCQTGAAVAEKDTEKVVKVLDMAAKTGNPVVTFYNSVGAKLEEGLAALSGSAAVAAAVAKVSGVVPQIAVVTGVCGAGSALAAAAADVCIVSKEGELFLTAPFTSAAAGDKLEGAPSLPPRRALRPLSWTAPRRPLPRQPNWWACCLPTIWPAPPCLSRPLLRAR